MNLINPKAVIDKMDGMVEIKSYLNKIKIIKKALEKFNAFLFYIIFLF